MVILVNNLSKIFGEVLITIIIPNICYGITLNTVTEKNVLREHLSKCPIHSEEFDDCMKNVFNDLTQYFTTGFPAYNIRPFDPHHIDFIELRRGYQNGNGGFKLILRDVSEYGWKDSQVTKYHTDFKDNLISYDQFFPEKSLEGLYEFTGNFLGTFVKRKGYWNMTLYNYSQSTTVRRLGAIGSMLKVRIEISKIQNMKLHVSNILAQNNANLDKLTDSIINSMWFIGLPIIKPIINELISVAFTDIFNDSFRYFPINNFLNYS